MDKSIGGAPTTADFANAAAQDAKRKTESLSADISTMAAALLTMLTFISSRGPMGPADAGRIKNSMEEIVKRHGS